MVHVNIYLREVNRFGKIARFLMFISLLDNHLSKIISFIFGMLGGVLQQQNPGFRKLKQF